jgi:glycine cleavage system H protein
MLKEEKMPFKIDEKARYTRSHEWVRVEGSEAVVGVTDYAQDKLSDVVFVDLPAVGKQTIKEKPFLVIESVKAAEDVFAPVSGTVSAANGSLSSKPELVNKDPFGEGWLARITMSNPKELDSLMDAAAYGRYLSSL